MTKKLMMVAACTAAVLMGSGVAQADPAKPGPDPNGPKCWVINDEQHAQLTPCGWAYSEGTGWYEVPPGILGIQ